MTQLQAIKNQIIGDIDYLLSVDIQRINPSGSQVQPYSGYDKDRIDKIVTVLIDSLNNLKEDIDVLDYLPFGVIEGIQTQLNQLVVDIKSKISVPSFSMTTEHHTALGYINAVLSYFYSNNLRAALDSKQPLPPDFLKVRMEVADFLKEKTSLEEATRVAKNILDLNKSLGDQEMMNLISTFSEKKKEYSITLVSIFSCIGIIIFIYVFFCSKSFSYEENFYLFNNIYEYLFYKVFTFVIPIALAVLSINLALHFLKLREFYEEKDAALSTMMGLLKYVSDTDKKSIYEQSLGRIFSDFKEKDGPKLTESTLLKLIEVAKK